MLANDLRIFVGRFPSLVLDHSKRSLSLALLVSMRLTIDTLTEISTPHTLGIGYWDKEQGLTYLEMKNIIYSSGSRIGCLRERDSFRSTSARVRVDTGK